MIASASNDRTVRFFDAQTGEELTNLKTHSSEAWSVAFSRNGKYIATAGTDFNVFLFDRSKLLQRSSFGFPVNVGGSWSAISPDRSRVALPMGPGVPLSHQTLWEVASQQQVAEFSAEIVSTGAFSPDSSVLATVNHTGGITFWNSVTGLEIRRFETQPTIAKGLVFAPDGKHVVLAGVDRTVRIRDVNNGVLLREVCRLDHTVTTLAISPDGRLIFVGSLDATARIFDFETGKVVAEIDKQPKAITSVAFSSDGQTFATGAAAGEIQIRRTSNATLIATLTGSAGRITEIIYSPEGTRLVSASADGVMRFWNTKTFDLVLAIRTGASYMSFLAFTPDGNTLLSHGNAGSIRLWEAAPPLNLFGNSPTIFLVEKSISSPDTTFRFFSLTEVERKSYGSLQPQSKEKPSCSNKN